MNPASFRRIVETTLPRPPRCEIVPSFTAPRKPDDEDARLEEVRRLGLLDTPLEERFERIVRLTADIFQAPISYVALVDEDRQWFKSRIGMPFEETPRNVSFCGHAILQEEALIIPDARKDLRFAGNPQVIGEPFVRFYAGQPLHGPNGFKVGTLCVLDKMPRAFGAREKQLLHELAALVEKELELHDVIEAQNEAERAREALAKSERELAATVRALKAAKQRADELLNNILPPALAAELLDKGSVTPVHHPEVAVMFTDFSGFTKFAATACPVELVEELNECFCHFDWAVSKYGGEKVKTIGDGFLAVAGMSESRPDDALRLLRAALEIRDYMLERKAERERAGIAGWDVRIGLHFGPLVAGVVGVRKLAYDVWGDTVNTASRVESAGVPGRVNVSHAFHERVRDLVISEPRGEIDCKNKGGVEMFFIDGIK